MKGIETFNVTSCTRNFVERKPNFKMGVDTVLFGLIC